MKTNTCENKSRKLRSILSAVLITILAFALFIGTFALAGCSDATQKAKYGADDNQNMIAAYSVALAANNDIATIDDNADFQMTLDRNTISSDWAAFTFVGWVWRLITCEGTVADGWKIFTGKNYQEIPLTMTSKEFTYDLTTMRIFGAKLRNW